VRLSYELCIRFIVQPSIQMCTNFSPVKICIFNLRCLINTLFNKFLLEESMDTKELMNKSIEISKCSISEDQNIRPKVGAILTNLKGEIIETAYRGEMGNGCHCEYSLFKKLEGRDVNYKETILYVTLEPCTSRGPSKTPCAQRIADNGVSKVYIGMLDPNPKICGRGESFLRQNTCVERYPSELITDIQSLNKDFFDMYKATFLPDTSLFATKQISEIIKEQLKGKNINIDISIDNWDFTLRDIINYCSYSKQDYSDDIAKAIEEARGYAYDKKYSDYSYDKDVRGLNAQWADEIRSILNRLNILDGYDSYNIIDVGEGNGLEAKALFQNNSNLTIVNISQSSLAQAKEIFTEANFILNSAENLIGVFTCSQDIYISLRVYQSSFFDINKAIEEAYRVLKPEGCIILSVANGFIGENNEIIPGLVIPGSRIVDRNRPYTIADCIRRKLTLLNFNNIGIETGYGEIFIYARRH